MPDPEIPNPSNATPEGLPTVSAPATEAGSPQVPTEGFSGQTMSAEVPKSQNEVTPPLSTSEATHLGEIATGEPTPNAQPETGENLTVRVEPPAAERTNDGQPNRKEAWDMALASNDVRNSVAARKLAAETLENLQTGYSNLPPGEALRRHRDR